jgi:hypothetical protein
LRRPTSAGSDTPKSGATNDQKLVLPTDVVLREPVGSAMPWYVRRTPEAVVTSRPFASSTWAWMVL